MKSISEKKYKLTEESISFGDRILHRIKAVRDFGNVKKGDKGGFIESEYNLSHDGNAWVRDDAKVFGGAKVYCDACISDNADVFGDAKVYGNANVYGTASICGYARVFGDAHVFCNASVFGNANVHGYACVSDNASVYGNALHSFTI